ncbi:MAG: MucB/RseB C-terminal domain-containing protein [Burkholderiaceae bacterium]|nr:MucB/RseB C-terminal domain-containing protein [Burkholderiaceae bacterium]
MSNSKQHGFAAACGLAMGLALSAPVAWAQAPATPTAQVAGAPQAQWTVRDWLERLHAASRQRAYMGTFVVSSGSDMAASKIWHVCDGVQQMERIETLTGTPRTTLRRNDEVRTFVPDQRLVLKERREALRLFPDLLHASDQRIESFYSARLVGSERVAGFDATVVDFIPSDALRHAYRIWSEKQTGLMLKMQTRTSDGRVLEQVAFTELQLDAPVRMDVLARQMNNTAGYTVIEPALYRTAPETLGWRLKASVPGFQSMSSYSRTDRSGNPSFQWIFSDGLASVSLFLETFDPERHTNEKTAAEGAMHSVSRKMGDYWVTALGEVPLETLSLFIQSLDRSR